MKKKILALVLSIALVFTGCGEKAVRSEQEVPGGYVEQQIAWPEDFYCTGIYPNADNSVTLLGAKGWQGWALSGYDPETNVTGYKGGIQIYDVQPDGTVILRDIPWEQQLIELCSNAPFQISMAMNETGDLYVLASEFSRFGFLPEQPFQLYKVENNTLLPIAMDFSKLDSDWWREMGFQDDFNSCTLKGISGDSFFIANGGTANWGIWDTNGNLHDSSTLRNGSSIYIHAIRNGYVWTGQSNDRDLAYTLPDFKSVGRMELPDGHIFPDYEGNGFYHMTHGFNYDTNQEEEKVLSHYTLDGDTREILMHGNDFSWGSLKVWDAAETPDHAFWAVLNDLNTQSLCRYAYDPNKAIQNTLTIFSMNGSNTLTQAITLWNKQHPETRIEHITGNQNADGTAMTEQDVVRQLNAQLLAGDGPDLLILDDLPAEALIRQEMLTDLSGLLDLEKVRPNVRSAFEQNEKLYGIPTGMNAYIAGGVEEDVDDRIRTLEGLADAVEEMPHPQSSADCCLSFVTPIYESVFDLFYPSSAAAIWQDGQFDQESFLTFARNVNRIARKSQLRTIAGYNQNLQDQQVTDSLSGEESYQRFHASSLNEFMNGNSRWFVANWDKASAASSFSRIAKDTSGQITAFNYPPIALSPLPGSEQSGVYVPSCIAAIPQSSTQNKELAIQFIQLMLSDELQSNPVALDGLPVTQSGLDLAFEKIREREPFILAHDPQALLDGMKPVCPDSVLWAAVREASAKLYDGEITEAEACDAIEESAALRLAEQE